MECANYEEMDSKVLDFLNCRNRTILVVRQLLDDPISPKVMSKMNPDGTFNTPCLHEMYPYLEDKVMKELMLEDKE